MPSLIHKFVLSLLRRGVIPNAMKKALLKGYVFRQAPTDTYCKKYDVSLSEFQEWPVLTYGQPKDGDPILYYCHGGGYVAGMFKSYYDAIGPLYKALKLPIIVPDYPMPFEVDALSMRRWVSEHLASIKQTYPNSPIVLGGDSAGANMALALAQGLGKGASSDLKSLYLLFGWLDLRRGPEDYPDNYEEVILDPALTPKASERFRGDLPADDPRISPILGDLSHLPPVRIVTGDKDMLHDDSIELERRLTELGKDPVLTNYPGYSHDFWLLPTPDGRRSLKNIARSIRADFGV